MSSASGFWFELGYNTKEYFRKQDERGRITQCYTITRFKRDFNLEVLSNDIDVKYVLTVNERSLHGKLKYPSQIKSYEFTSDGNVVKVHIELNNGLQPDNKITTEGENVSGCDGSKSNESNVVESGPKEVGLPTT